MNARIVATMLCVFLFTLWNGALLFDEGNDRICPPDAKSKAEVRAEDPFPAMRFNPTERENNLKSFGLTGDEVKATLNKIGSLEERYQIKDPQLDLVTARIQGSEDDGLESAFCGADTTLPVRYGAMAYLVKERDGKLRAVDLEEVSSFSYQQWAREARIPAVYAEADLTKDRKDDSVKMAMAALLARDEATLLEHKSPWGRGVIVGGWSWDAVQKKHPGIKERVLDYIAVLHVVLEVARREGGLCPT